MERLRLVAHAAPGAPGVLEHARRTAVPAEQRLPGTADAHARVARRVAWTRYRPLSITPRLRRRRRLGRRRRRARRPPPNRTPARCTPWPAASRAPARAAPRRNRVMQECSVAIRLEWQGVAARPAPARAAAVRPAGRGTPRSGGSRCAPPAPHVPGYGRGWGFQTRAARRGGVVARRRRDAGVYLRRQGVQRGELRPLASAWPRRPARRAGRRRRARCCEPGRMSWKRVEEHRVPGLAQVGRLAAQGARRWPRQCARRASSSASGAAVGELELGHGGVAAAQAEVQLAAVDGQEAVAALAATSSCSASNRRCRPEWTTRTSGCAAAQARISARCRRVGPPPWSPRP